MKTTSQQAVLASQSYPGLIPATTHYMDTSKESGPRGPGLEFTPEGCNLIPVEYWNDGKMETGKSLVADAACAAELSGASANHIGAKHRTILISSRRLTPPFKKMTQFSQPHYSTSPLFHHSSAVVTGKAIELEPGPEDQVYYG